MINKEYKEFDCVFQCIGCGLLPDKNSEIESDEGKFTAFCRACKQIEFYECLRVLQSRGAHDKCINIDSVGMVTIGTYPTNISSKILTENNPTDDCCGTHNEVINGQLQYYEKCR